ncbi:MAG: hypothetical protein GXX86_06655, partial [Propionibacterium sp.]|nr:hypothetical protein [Propionibacterium sp.]
FSVVHPRFIDALLQGPLAGANLTLENGVVTVWQDSHLTFNAGTMLPRQLAGLVALFPRQV